jgi:sec-independent protein translocase protein TatB
MFDLFSWSHILILLVVALVVVGPKDLPRLMHMAGKWAGKARDMASEFRRSFDEMARQTELDELRKEIEELKKNNPVNDVTHSMSEVTAEIDRAVQTSDGTADVEGAGQTPADTSPAVEGGPEPRSGEFQVTEAPAPAELETAQAASEPAPAGRQTAS